METPVVLGQRLMLALQLMDAGVPVTAGAAGGAALGSATVEGVDLVLEVA